MKSASLGVVAALAWSAAGCGIFSPHESVVLAIAEVEAPTGIPPGTQLSVVLTVQTGGCTTFDRLQTERDGSSATVTAWGRSPAKGRNLSCTADIRYDRHTVRFDPPFGSTFNITVSQPLHGQDGPAHVVTVRIQ